MDANRQTFRFLGRVEVSLHITRKACEHFAFSGALVDFLAAVFRMDAFLLIVFAKFCLVAGAIGVFLVHKEEQFREKEHREQAKPQEVQREAA